MKKTWEQAKNIRESWKDHLHEITTLPTGEMAAVQSFMFTHGLLVELDVVSYGGRYCYETYEEAVAALRSWDGNGDPPGDWIKYKGLDGERLGPGAIL